MSFYHKYRPQKFSDLIGQDHVKKTLTNAILHGKTGHAYLFSGPRGAGKTTVARLLAKSLNCKTTQKDLEKDKKIESGYEPCDECMSCQEITSGRSLDVIEIDAASNRGIDEIRELRDKIKFAPSKSHYKVFIIDEVHMLTKEAFNALLKTLEEPPAHAIFILATTEFHKIPATILSRVQSFNFKRAGLENILEYLDKIIASEKINIDPEALRLIASAGDGSYRDATSILDQIASAGAKKITRTDVEDVLGIADNENVSQFLCALSSQNSGQALSIINKLFADGYDLGEFNKQLIEYIRQIILYKNGNIFLEKAELDKEQKEKIIDLSKVFSMEEALEMINLFISAGLDIKGNNLPQLPLEIAVIKICGLSNNNKSINQQINRTTEEQDNKITREQNNQMTEGPKKIKIDEPKNSSASPRTDEGTKKQDVFKEEIRIEKITRTEVIAKPDQKKEMPKNKTVDSINIKEKWPKVLEEMGAKNRSLYLILKESEPLKIENDKFTIGIKFKLYAERLNEKRNYQIVGEAIEKIYGKNYPLGFLVSDKLAAQQAPEAPKEKKEESASPKINSLVSDTLEIFGN